MWERPQSIRDFYALEIAIWTPIYMRCLPDIIHRKWSRSHISMFIISKNTRSNKNNRYDHDFLIPLSIGDQHVLSESPFQFANGLRQSGTAKHTLKIQSTYLSSQANWPSGWSAGFRFQNSDCGHNNHNSNGMWSRWQICRHLL